MKNKNTVALPPGGKESRDCSEIPDPCCPHGVSESQFPHRGRCFNKNVSEFGTAYEAFCPYCSIWTSLPEGAALRVTRIFDCAACGYGKRMTEEDK